MHNLGKLPVVSAVRHKALSPLFSFSSETNISYAVIKGEPLSVLAYGKPGQRQSGDTDILVPISYVPKIKAELSRLGFKVMNSNRQHQIAAISSTNQSIPYRKNIGSLEVEVDINHDIFWGEYSGKRVSIEEFLSDTIEVDIYGCKIKTLSPLKAMIQLILHHYHDFNSIYRLTGYNCIKFNMFKDIYFLWNNNKEAISRDLYLKSCEYGIIPYVYYILYYTNIIFKDTDLEKLVMSHKTSEGGELLKCYGLTAEERREWKVDFFTRLNNADVFQFIKNDLSKVDFEKIKRGKEIFG